MVIMGGLLVATFMTPVFLPTLYGLWFKMPCDTQPSASEEEVAESAVSPVAAG